MKNILKMSLMILMGIGYMPVQGAAAARQEEDKKEAAARSIRPVINTPEHGVSFWLLQQFKKHVQANPATGHREGIVTDIKDVIKEFVGKPWTQFQGESIELSPIGADYSAVSPNGHRLAAISSIGNEQRRVLRVWDMRNKDIKPLEVVFSHREVHGLAVSNDRIAVLFDDAVLLYSFAQGNDQLYLEATLNFGRNVNHNADKVVFSSNGRYLGISLQGHRVAGRALMWDMQNLQPDNPQEFEVGFPFLSINFSPDSRYFACGGAAHGAHTTLWDLQESKGVQIRGESRLTVQFSPDGCNLAMAGIDSIAIFDVCTRKYKPGVSGSYRAMAFSFDSRYLALARLRDVLLYDMFNMYAQPRVFQDRMTDQVIFSRDGYMLLRSAEKIAIHDVQYPGVEPKVLQGRFKNMFFVPDTSALVTASSREGIRVWNWSVLTKEMVQERKKIETQRAKEWFGWKQSQKRPGEHWSNWLSRITSDFDLSAGRDR